jgi:hypothetical protein
LLWTRNAAAALVMAFVFGANQVVRCHATAVEIFGLGVFFVALAFLLPLAFERIPAAAWSTRRLSSPTRSAAAGAGKANWRGGAAAGIL